MAKEKLEHKLQRYQEELDRSQKFLQNEGYLDLWARMVDLYRGRHYETQSEHDRLIVNMAKPTIDAIAPSVAVNNPKFTVEARKPEFAPQAVINQEVLNYLWRTHKFQRQFRLAVNDSLMVGHGWLKVGYKRVKKPVEKPVKDGEADGPGIDDRSGKPGDSETEMRVVDDRPFVQRISYTDMFVDPDGRNLDEIRWIAQRVRRAVNDVKVDSRYEPSARSQVQPTGWKWRRGVPQNPHEESEHNESNSIGYVDVIEFYDLRANTVSTFAAGCGTKVGFLIKPKQIPYAFGHPFVMIRNYEIPDFFYPMGELEAMESLQHELNETRTQLMNHRKRNARKWLYAEGYFSKDGLAALESDEDNVMVPVNHDDVHSVIAPLPGQPLQGDLYAYTDTIEQSINTVTATSEYARGATPNIRRTATEAAMIQDAQNSRAADKLAAIESFLAECGSRVIQLMQQYMSGQQVVRIVGATQTPVWLQFDKDYIAGEFDFSVEGGSTQPRNESFRRQAAMQFMDAISGFIGSGVIDPMAAARHVLTEFGIKNPESFLAAPMTPGGMPGAPVPGQMGGVPAGVPPVGPQPDSGMPPDPIAGAQDSPVPGIPTALLNQVTAQSGLDIGQLV